MKDYRLSEIRQICENLFYSDNKGEAPPIHHCYDCPIYHSRHDGRICAGSDPTTWKIKNPPKQGEKMSPPDCGLFVRTPRLIKLTPMPKIKPAPKRQETNKGQIEEMLLTCPQIIVAYDGNPKGQHLYGEQRRQIAEAYYNAGYRKVDEKPTAIDGFKTDCAYRQMRAKELADKVREETAKEILKAWYRENIAKGDEQDFVLELAEKYGVEVEE